METAFLKSGADLAKRYLNLVLQRVEVNGDEVRLEVDTAALLSGDIHKQEVGTANQDGTVPTFVIDWLSLLDDFRNWPARSAGNSRLQCEPRSSVGSSTTTTARPPDRHQQLR